MSNALYRITLLTILLFTSSNALATSIPGKQNTQSNQPYPPWNSVRLDYENDPQKYIRKIKENEYYEARGSLIWIPLIKHVTQEAAAAGAIHPDHKILFSNLLYGLISVETTGLFYQTGDFGNTSYQQTIGSFRGLSQLVAEKLYLEENPYEPLTAIRAGLRNLAPFVYHSQSILSALAEHNNGKTNPKDSRIGVDAYCTIGQEFSMRTINAIWAGHQLSKAEKFDTLYHFKRQTNLNTHQQPYSEFFPEWRVFQYASDALKIRIPNIPFNWIPPSSSLAWQYINDMPGSTLREKQHHLINRVIEDKVWEESVVFNYPIDETNSSIDKSYCAELVDGNQIILEGIDVPRFLYSESLDFRHTKLSLFSQNHWTHYYPKGPLGSTPASQKGQHQYLTIKKPSEDVIGINKQGVIFIETRFSRKWSRNYLSYRTEN